eukprot:1936470-Rhodomonas_salina.1
MYGFYDNQAITRLRADAYGDALRLNDTPLQDVLNMPLPEQPLCATCNFDRITDAQFPMRNTIDVDAYADRNNATDKVARQVYGNNHNDEDDDDCVHDNDSVTEDATDKTVQKRVREHGGE